VVSSAIIKPPKSVSKGKVAYMLFALHGAGVENNSPFWADDAYRDLNDINAFIIQPSGVTSWGDDWHGAWSFNDVESARLGAYHWSIAISPCVPLDYQFFFWAPAIVAGHSNGGSFLATFINGRTRNLVCFDTLVRFEFMGCESNFWVFVNSCICAIYDVAASRWEDETY
jgi:hypothetical protein